MNQARSMASRLAVAALLPLLGGCVAVAALPVLAGGAIATRSVLGEREERAADAPPSNATDEQVSGGTAGSPYQANSGEVRPAPMAALPAPAVVASDIPRPGTGQLPGSMRAASAPWQAFVTYALERFADSGAGKAESVLLEPLPSLTSPRFRQCSSSKPAVIIDLDPGKDPLSPGASLSVPTGLAEDLARLRQAGVLVIWLSGQSADHVDELGDALMRSGLDPSGSDPLLLGMTASDRKQTLREKAAEDACIIAIAGDRRGDFDEVFDYLRNPEEANLVDFKLGEGWFLVPPPLG